MPPKDPVNFPCGVSFQIHNVKQVRFIYREKPEVGMHSSIVYFKRKSHAGAKSFKQPIVSAHVLMHMVCCLYDIEISSSASQEDQHLICITKALTSSKIQQLYNMGTRWHNPLCSAPEVIIDEKTSLPRCRSCNEAPRLAELIASVRASYEPPPIPPDEKIGDDLGLFWPESVPYTRGTLTPLPRGGEINAPALENDNSGVPSASQGVEDSLSPIYAHQLRVEEFRLLYLASRREDDSEWLCIELKTFTHDNCPDYEAVSYTWGGEEGDSTPCKPLFIGPYWDILLQTKNCWAMLDTMRPRTGQRVLWVDAICINQERNKEREDQVAKMCQIYEESLRVLVFLGDDIVQPVEKGTYAARRKLCMLSSNRTDEQSSERDQKIVHTLESILKRRYFTRIWVVQELILSRQVMIRIGDTEYWVDHQTSRDIVKVDHEWNWTRTAAPWFQYASQRSLGAEHQLNLLDVIRMTWGCQSADPRDRVFGILGFAQVGDAMPELHPNYSISTQHVFIGVFAYCLINLGESSVFTWASESQGRSQLLSWIPAWNSPGVLQDSVDYSSAALRLWRLKWQREVACLMNRRRFETEQLNKATLQYPALRRAEFDKVREPYYCILEDFHSIPGSSPEIIHFLPILTDIERSEMTHWFAHASISTETGFLSIPLIHFMCIKYKPVLISQMGSIRCYRIPSVPSHEDPDSDIINISNSERSQPAKEISTHNPTSLFFTTRSTKLDEITPAKSHIFILDKGSLGPLFLILSETEHAGVFNLTASSKEILFSRVSIYHSSSGVTLQKIRKTWNLIGIFRSMASKTPNTKFRFAADMEEAAWDLWGIFIREPRFEELVQASKVSSDNDSLLSLYLSWMNDYHALYVPNNKHSSTSGFVELRLKPEDWKAAKPHFPHPTYGNDPRAPVPGGGKLVFGEWRDNDGIWKRFKDKRPADSNHILCIRGDVEEILRDIKTGLKALNFVNRVKMDKYCGCETEDPQAWTIPWLSWDLYSSRWDFNGRTYQVQIA